MAQTGYVQLIALLYTDLGIMTTKSLNHFRSSCEANEKRICLKRKRNSTDDEVVHTSKIVISAIDCYNFSNVVSL